MCQLCKLVWRWSCSIVTENTMPVVQVLFLLFALVSKSCEMPFVFEENVDFCSYPVIEKQEKIEMASNTWTVRIEQSKIYYKLCGKFKDKDPCPVGTSACLQDHNTGRKVVLGTEFSLEGNSTFKSINGSPCSKSTNYSLIVDLQCPEKVDASLIYIGEDKCTYHVPLRDPRCPPKCTGTIDGKFIDLRPLGLRSFTITTADRNFSVSLCDSDPVCGGEGVNACETIGDRRTPISLASSISVSYNGEKNQLSFHGQTYKGEASKRKIDKRFEVFLKCDWDKNYTDNSDLKYVKKQTQGKRYTFELDTPFGCIKKPVPCVVNDQFLVYNLSGLYTEHQEMWSANGGSQNNDSIYFLQVCGPVVLTGKNTSCKSTYAQVCENKDGIDINRGAVFRRLQVVNDVLKATIENGMQCKDNKDLQYKTFINFYCDEHEQGPQFLQQTSCDTYFNWMTPHACPKYNDSRCNHIRKDHHSCSFRKGNKYYDLGELTKTDKSIPSGNEVFSFNICGPVIDPEAPCMKDVSVIVKKLKEYNLKDKIISLGKFSGTSMRNGSLILEYATGFYCDGTDYTSEIRFECSDVEEEPVIFKQEKCFYEFLWRTKYGCPHQIRHDKKEKRIEDLKNCTYVDHSSKRSTNFGSFYQTAIYLQDAKYRYTFDICQQNYTKCTLNDEDCQYVSIEKTAFKITHNLTSLEFTLPTGCQTMDDFNKVNFKFICDEIKNNDHITFVETIHCTLVVNYFTNLVCSSQDSHIPNEDIKHVDSPVFLNVDNLAQQKPVEVIIDCFTRSPFTNHELNISNLTLNNGFFKKKCPTVTFNDTYGFVRLLYVTTDMCRPTPSKNMSYEVYLKCTNDKLIPSVNDECLNHYNYEKPEYCDFFKSPKEHLISSSGSTIGLVVGILVIITVLSVGIFVAIKKRKCMSRRPYDDFASVYQKDTEL